MQESKLLDYFPKGTIFFTKGGGIVTKASEVTSYGKGSDYVNREGKHVILIEFFDNSSDFKDSGSKSKIFKKK